MRFVPDLPLPVTWSTNETKALFLSLCCWGLIGIVCSLNDVRGDEVERPMLTWSPAPPLPDRHGIAAPFAGTDGPMLLVAGGANFPDRMPWEGGQKVWHDRVWGLRHLDGSWNALGRLPQPLAYGVSISLPEGLLCIGGSDQNRHYAAVMCLSYHNERLEITQFPELPRPIANACGALLGSTIYVAGGTSDPQATSTLGTFYQLDLNVRPHQWRELPTWPGPPRMLAVAAICHGKFYLLSGTSLSPDDGGLPKRHYLTDAYCYDPRDGWSRLPDLPRATVAAPSPAPVLQDAQVLVLGGDDGRHIGFQPPDRHPGFSTEILAFNTTTQTWHSYGDSAAPRVTLPLVQWGEVWIQVSGEVRPGVRSPEVWTLRPNMRSNERK